MLFGSGDVMLTEGKPLGTATEIVARSRCGGRSVLLSIATAITE
jgi:hypothetical protein